LEDGVSENRVIISFGYILLGGLLIPMSLMNLDGLIFFSRGGGGGWVCWAFTDGTSCECDTIGCCMCMYIVSVRVCD